MNAVFVTVQRLPKELFAQRVKLLDPYQVQIFTSILKPLLKEFNVYLPRAEQNLAYLCRASAPRQNLPEPAWVNSSSFETQRGWRSMLFGVSTISGFLKGCFTCLRKR